MTTRCLLAAAMLVSLALATVGVRTSSLVGAEPAATGAAPSTPTETKEQHDARMKWWREARFGMFIHWGLYAVPAGEYNGRRSTRIGEWIMEWANIPRAEYEKFAAQFNPVKFNAAEWVRIAKDAGMKYLVITSKHHDGFAIYDSKVSDYDIVDATPYKKDLMKQLADECKKQGVTFCFYYSIVDWHHPTAYVDAPGKDPTAGHRQTKLKEGGKEQYVKYMKEQLRELVTTYDPAVLWFDGEWQDWWTQEDGKELYAWLRTLKPNIIINNRVGKSRKGMEGLNKADQEVVGDFGTPEQQIPPRGLPGVDWESCMTLNDTWGYKFYDNNWKSTETLVRNLIDIVSKGGNYLLNVGPKADGEIPPETVERLAEMGKWMKVNGEAIYGSGASPFAEALPFGRATSKPGRVYLHVFDWPKDGQLKVPALDKSVKKAYLLADKGPTGVIKGSDGSLTLRANKEQTIEVTKTGEGLTLKVPAAAPDKIASVIVLETE